MKGLMDLPERILDKIEALPDAPGCWLWTGCLANGYGRIRWRGQTRGAHRVVYELLVGPITKPTLDHKCRTRCCVYPEHLRPATNSENLLAPGSLAPTAINAAKMSCPRGHPYDDANTCHSNGGRICRACARERYSRNREERKAYMREYYAKHRKEANVYQREYRAKRKAKRVGV
jgi:hypothetical protein